MKVLFIVTAYPRRAGDVITPWLVETIRRLERSGVQVEVLAPSYRGQEDQVVEGVRVHRFRYAPRRWETLTHDQTAPDRIRERPYLLALVPGYVWCGRRAARRVVRTGGFHVVHAFWPLPHALLGIAGKKAGRVPLVCTFFGVELTWLDSQLGFLKPLVRRLIRASDAVTVISSYTAAAVRRLVPDVELRRIPFGAAVEVAAAPGVPQSARRRVGPYRLIFIGRLVERKGVHVLLDAVASIAERRPVRATIVGDGPLAPQLKERASELGLADVVEFTGSISASGLVERLEESDALVLPAVRDAKGDVEGLGVVLMEALLHGKPVIASASGGIVDIVRHEETGLLVPPGDAALLTAAIERYMDDAALAARLARAGAEHVRRSFGWDTITGDLVRLYQELTGGREKERS